jgi:hypothetical protein
LSSFQVSQIRRLGQKMTYKHIVMRNSAFAAGHESGLDLKKCADLGNWCPRFGGFCQETRLGGPKLKCAKQA